MYHRAASLVVKSAGAGRGDVPVGPADQRVQLPPVVQAIMAHDPPRGDAVVVVGSGQRELGDDLQDYEAAVGGLQLHVHIAIQFTVDERDLPVDARAGGPPPAGCDLVDAGRPVQPRVGGQVAGQPSVGADRKSTRLNSSHRTISYAVFCLKKKTTLRDDKGFKERTTQLLMYVLAPMLLFVAWR